MKLFAISVICPDLSRLGDFTARFIGIISRNRDGAYCIAPLLERDVAFHCRRLTYSYLTPFRENSHSQPPQLWNGMSGRVFLRTPDPYLKKCVFLFLSENLFRYGIDWGR